MYLYKTQRLYTKTFRLHSISLWLRPTAQHDAAALCNEQAKQLSACICFAKAVHGINRVIEEVLN